MQNTEQHIYIAIDLKSFYASVECQERGLNPLTTNLVVADNSRTEKTVCLAVTPSLKQYGIGGRARLFEVVQKEAKEIIGNFKKIYKSSNIDEAKIQLEFFQKEYGEKQKRVVKKVEEFMVYLEPLFELPAEIRKCIYTTNAIESVNSALRKVTRGKGAFPSESSVYKVMFLRIRELSEKWKKPMQN